jgi:DNA mismatch repair protein MSH3
LANLNNILILLRYVDELDSVDELEKYSSPPFMCIIEEPQNKNSSAEVSIGMISICPSTGDIVWDDFDGTQYRFSLLFHRELLKYADGVMRIELEVNVAATFRKA